MKIKKITKLEEKHHTYDIEVKNKHHYIFDNGCVSHNSSLTSNSTNGIEPIRDYITTKKSKMGLLRMVAPEYSRLKNKYQLAWEIKDNKSLTNVQAVIQKWIDQAISSNHYYDYTQYENNDMPISRVIKDILYSYQMGAKTLYYANTNDGKTDVFEDKTENKNVEESVENNMEYIEDGDCLGGACSI